MSTVLVVGASRGIGAEFVRQYVADGARVYATCRKPEDRARLREMGAKPIELDVLDPAAIRALALHDELNLLDGVILSAGVLHPRSTGITAPEPADFDYVMHTNVRAPMMLIPVLAPALQRAKGKLAVMSSRMSSLSLMETPGRWLYRVSKAAVNGVVKAASLELGPSGVVCMAFHPGWVRTDMGGKEADIDVRESVTGMRRVIAAANQSHNGKFLNYTGEQIPW